MKVIPLTQGFVALVDDADFERVSACKWRVRRKNERTIYAVTGHGIRMHRFILRLKDPTVQVDHRHRNGLNNQRGNLIKCVNGENQINKPKQKGAFTSQYKGVHWDKGTNRFRTQLVVHGRKIYGGSFRDEVPAAVAYDAIAREHFGEFALCNFPPKISCGICAPALDFPVGARIA